MSSFEATFLACAGLLYAASVVFAVSESLRAAFLSIVSALGLHLISTAIRWAGSGHPPIFGTYEATLAASWFLALFVALSYRTEQAPFRILVLSAVPLAVLLLLYGAVLFDTSRMPLTISERSLWVDVHALFAWLAFAPLTLAGCLSAYVLWSSGKRSPRTSTRGERELSADSVDEMAFRYIATGFIFHSAMFALGSYYSSILFGTWWRWDPAFSLSLVAWLLIGLYIHMRLFYYWHGSRAASMYLAVYAAIVVSYWGLIYLPAGRTFHVFDLDLKAF